ncbi:MAG: hypothetical protein ACKN9I_06395 [Alphaproteobacteria bacterium]
MPDSLILNIVIIGFGFTLCCIFLIFVIRAILELIIYISYKNYQDLKKKTQQYFPNNKKNFIKEEEELRRYKDEIPKAHSRTKLEKKLNEAQAQYQKMVDDILQEEEEKVVGVVKPVGFWTSKIFGERIATIIAQAESMKKGESTKFWQNFVKASRVQTRFQDNSKQR